MRYVHQPLSGGGQHGKVSNAITVKNAGSRVVDGVVAGHVRETTAVSEEVVNGALIGNGGIAKSKRHYSELKAPKRRLKCSSRDMLGVYATFVVALREVHLGEIFRACHIVDNVRQGVLIHEGDGIECAVVDAKS